jgi:hypothetical protein
MKSFVIAIFALFITTNLISQDIIEKSIAINTNQEVEVNFDFADQIIIKKWDKKEASVKVIVNINDNEDNDRFNLDVSNSLGSIHITGEIDNIEDIGQSKTIISHGEIIRNDNHCINMEIDCEIYLPENAGITLETISGDVEIIGFTAPLEINSISGFVDVSIEKSAKANIVMETITGEFYSDLALEATGSAEWKHHWIGGKFESTINGGGQKIHLETVSGNIYLREF